MKHGEQDAISLLLVVEICVVPDLRSAIDRGSKPVAQLVDRKYQLCLQRGAVGTTNLTFDQGQ